MFRSVLSPSVLLLINFVAIIDGKPGTGDRFKKVTKFQPKYDTSGQRQAAKVIHMMREVILDMQRKIETHSIIVQKWQLHRRFQIAQIVFEIRRKSSMLKSILKQNLIWDNIKEEFLVRNRTDSAKKDYMSIKDMVRCQYETIEIDKLVQIVERYQWARLHSGNIHLKYKYPLRTSNQTDNENKKTILRKLMNNNNNKKDDLNKLVEQLEDISEDNLKDLLNKIGDIPQKGTKNIGDMRQEGFKQIRKMAETHKTTDVLKHPGEGFEEDDDEAWK